MKRLILMMVAALCLCYLHAATQTGKIGPNARWTYNTTTREFRISGTGPTYDGSYEYNGMFHKAPRRADTSPIDTSAVETDANLSPSPIDIPIVETHVNASLEPLQGTISKSARKKAKESPYGAVYFKYGAEVSGDAYTFDPQQVKSIVVEEGITKLGEWTCAFFYNAETVSLPKTLQNLCGGAFLDDSLLTEIVVPENVDTMQYATCKSQASMYGSNIIYGAFSGCTHLSTIYWNAKGSMSNTMSNPLRDLEDVVENLHIGKAVEHIPQEMCLNFTKLKGEIRLEKNMKTLGYHAFAGCRGITKVSLLADSLECLSTPFYQVNPVMYYLYHGSPFTRYGGELEVFIGKDVRYIGEYMFSNYECFGRLVSGENPTYGSSKREYLDSIHVTFEAGSQLRTIAVYAFAGARGLRNLKLPEQVEDIYPHAFYDTDIRDVTIPESVQGIGVNAFSSCPNIEKIYFNAKNAQVLPTYAFSQKATVYTYQSPFLNCAESLSIEIGNTVRLLRAYMFMGGTHTQTYDATATERTNMQQRVDIKEVKIDDDNILSYIDDYAFAACSNLKQFDFQKCELLATIDDYAFPQTGLTSITIPDNTVYIGISCFADCSALKNLTIGRSVSSIKKSAFKNTTIDVLTTKRNNPPSLEEDAFSTVRLVYVPCGRKEAYEAVSGWQDFNIQYAPPQYNIQGKVAIFGEEQVKGGEGVPGTVKVINESCSTTIEAFANKGFKFKRWSDYGSRNPREVYLTRDTVITALFERLSYTVRFLDYDGTLLQESQVPYNTMPTPPADPQRRGTEQYTYIFSGWTPKIVPVTGDTTYTASYTTQVREYTITFVNEDGTVLSSEKWKFGDMPTYSGPTPTKAADEQYEYTFFGWTPLISMVRDEATYMATYSRTLRQYTITFLNDDMSLIEKRQWKYGDVPTCTAPEKTATDDSIFVFIGWRAADDAIPLVELPSVTRDTTYLATYESRGMWYLITFLDWDGTVLNAADWRYGYMPSCAAPHRPDDDTYTYIFSAWEPDIVPVVAVATYTATYTATEKGTGVENVGKFDGKSRGVQYHKVLYNGHVYILAPDGSLYDMTGRKTDSR